MGLSTFSKGGVAARDSVSGSGMKRGRCAVGAVFAGLVTMLWRLAVVVEVCAFLMVTLTVLTASAFFFEIAIDWMRSCLSVTLMLHRARKSAAHSLCNWG